MSTTMQVSKTFVDLSSDFTSIVPHARCVMCAYPSHGYVLQQLTVASTRDIFGDMLDMGSILLLGMYGETHESPGTL